MAARRCAIAVMDSVTVLSRAIMNRELGYYLRISIVF